MKKKVIICAVSVLLILAVSQPLIRKGIPSKVLTLEEYEHRIMRQYGDGNSISEEHLKDVIEAVEEYIRENRLQLWITDYEVADNQITVSFAGSLTHVFLPRIFGFDSIDSADIKDSTDSVEIKEPVR